MKRKFLALFCIFCLVFTLFAGCGGTSENEGNESENGSAEAETIKIGLNYELSGDVASYGQDCVAGIELAIKEINASGGVLGKQIELVKMDNKSDAAEATNITTRLITEKDIVAMLGPATSGLTKASTQIVTQHQVPLISTSATADEVTVNADGSVNDFIFRICYNDAVQGAAMADYALSKLGATKAIIMIDNASDYSVGLQGSFAKTFTEGGGEIVKGDYAFAPSEQDFNAILTKMKGIDADVIYLPVYYPTAGLIIKQARELGIETPFLGADGYDSPVLLDIAGDTALNQVYFSNHYFSKDTNPAIVKFTDAFKAETQKDPGAFNALGYDLGYFVADAITRAGEADPVKIKDALASTVDFPGVTGTLSVDENHNVVKLITVLELVNGEQTFSESIDPNAAQ